MNDSLLALGVALAGGAGAALRYFVDNAFPAGLRARFPWGILTINLTGSLALGAVTGLALGHGAAAVLGIGLLGGYTTFSTASLDTVRLLRARRFLAALANGPGMLLASTGLAVLGIVAVRG